MKILGQAAPGSLGPGLHPADIRLQDLALFVEQRHQSIAKFSRSAESQRAIGRNIDGNRLFQVDEFQVLVQKFDRPRGAVQAIFDLFSAQQGADYPQVFAEISDLHRLHTHDPHGRMTGPNPQKGPAGGEAINRGNRVRRHRGNARPRNSNPGADTQTRGVLGSQRQGGVTVRPDHLGIRHPGRVKA